MRVERVLSDLSVGHELEKREILSAVPKYMPLANAEGLRAR